MENDLHGLCSHCGEPLKPSATFCRACGSSDESGWNETEEGFAEEEFDYDEFVAREFGEDKPDVIPHGLHWFWWLVGLGLIAALILMWV